MVILATEDVCGQYYNAIRNSISDPGAYGAFIRIDPMVFKRALSDLINNAVEAIQFE